MSRQGRQKLRDSEGGQWKQASHDSTPRAALYLLLARVNMLEYCLFVYLSPELAILILDLDHVRFLSVKQVS